MKSPDSIGPLRGVLARLPHLTSGALPPVLLGAASFWLVTGGRMVFPTNIAWIRGEDQAQHYLGWAFYRQGPWTWPLGANPDWGLEFSNSVLYSDSIPLLAFVFKPFRQLLPHPFQYLGVWVLLCFALQAWVAWKIASRFTRSSIARLCAAGLFVFAPPMLFRLTGHWALVGHWTILAALYLWLTPREGHRAAWWTLLAAGATWIHMYLALIVAVLWGAAWAAAAWDRERPWRALALEALAVPGAMVLALWQAGFFLVRDGKTGFGYGRFGLNLNALVDPQGWSYLLPALGSGDGDYEGFAYLGLGGLCLLAPAIFAALRLARAGRLGISRRWLPLGVAFLALTVFAASNRVGIGAREFVYPIPSFVQAAGEMARASGRLFWPVFYGLLVAALALICRGYAASTSAVILACALAVQVADTSRGWLRVNPSLAHRGRSWPSPLTHAFWFEAPAVYRHVRLIRPRNGSQHWLVLSDYAQRHGMATDAAFLSRVDRPRYLALLRRTERLLLEGGFDPDSVYVFDGSEARRVPCAVDPQADLLAIIDGMWVLAPGWNHRFGDSYPNLTRLPCPSLSPKTLTFGIEGSGLALLGTGWDSPEGWGTWSRGEQSALNVHVGIDQSVLEVDVDAFVPPGAPPLDVAVAVDGTRVDTWRFDSGHTEGWRQITLPVGSAPRRARVTFSYSATRAPADWGRSSDTRRLALALRQARLSRAVKGAPAPNRYLGKRDLG